MKAIMEEHAPTRRLVEQAKSGDRSAFDRLVEDSRGRLEAVLLSTLSQKVQHIIDVEEALQETMVRAFESLQNFQWRGEGSFSAWLRRIAKNVVVGEIRKKRPSHGLRVVERIPAKGAAPSTAARRDERFDRLKAALGGLNPDHREVLLLARIEGLPIREIAERMQRSPNAVKQLLSRALKALRSSFGDTESLHLPDRCLGGDSARHEE
jgi:RNA polymerase sigma-70 factor (ECF subfamily)